MRPLLIAVLLGLMAPAAANAAPDSGPYSDCFSSTQWRGWSAPGDSNVLLLRVGNHNVYRVELTPGTRVHRSGSRFLVNEVHGSTWICSPLDLDLTLNEPHFGVVQPLIATSLHRMTPEEIEAIPLRDRPS